MKTLLIAALLLTGCSCTATKANVIKTEVEFVDLEGMPYADSLHVCVPQLDQRIRCVTLELFLQTVREMQGGAGPASMPRFDL